MHGGLLQYIFFYNKAQVKVVVLLYEFVVLRICIFSRFGFTYRVTE